MFFGSGAMCSRTAGVQGMTGMISTVRNRLHAHATFNSCPNRWFILQPDQGILTYYLLTSAVSDTIASSPSRLDGPRSMSHLSPITEAARSRTTSFDSSITDNTINYDVIPRGTIFLLNCKVSVNEALTNIRERLYIFTIEPPNSKEAKVHLAARSAQVRDAWVRQISRVCEAISAPPRMSAPVSAGTLRQASDSNGSFDVDQDTPVNSIVVETRTVAIEEGWNCVNESSDVYANISESLRARIKREITENLLLCDLETPNSTEWQKLYSREDGSAAYQKRNAATQPIIMTKMPMSHPVKQVFNLLVDPSRRLEFETNLRVCERMQVLSPNTFFDYYSYNAIWPSRPREFAVSVHWQIIQKENQKAIVIVAFSCDEASALKQVQDNHVRANLFVNLTLLRYTGPDTCHVTRVLSYSLGGGIPAALSNYIVAQQVGSLRAVADRLSRYEPLPSDRLKGPLARDSIIIDIIQRIGTERADAMMFPHPESDDEDLSLVVSESGGSASESSQTALMIFAALMAFPLVIYYAATTINIRFPGLWFLVSVFLVARQLVWLHFAGIPSIARLKPEGPRGVITCRFQVDLKGVLRFLANKKEDRKPRSSDVSVVHIVGRACALALKKHQLHTNHLSIPWLLIDEHLRCKHEHVSVSFILEQDQIPITIDAVDEKTVQDIADSLESERERKEGKKIGSCLVVACNNPDDSDIEMDSVSVAAGVNLVAIIGNVGLDRKHTGPAAPRPTLQLSLTVGSTQSASFSSARRLAEEVKKLILYPEICDEA